MKKSVAVILILLALFLCTSCVEDDIERRARLQYEQEEREELEAYYEDGYAFGYDEGYGKGYDEGYEEGYSDAKDET